MTIKIRQLPGLIERGYRRALTLPGRTLQALDRAFVRTFGEVPALGLVPAGPGNLSVCNFSASGTGPSGPQTIHPRFPGNLVIGVTGTYKILRLFNSSGGMSSILEVQDNSSKKFYLLKVNAIENVEEGWRQHMLDRFDNEVKILQKINELRPQLKAKGVTNTHLMTLVDRDPTFPPMYYVMEKAKGVNLAEHIASQVGGLDPAQAGKIITKTLFGLSIFDLAMTKDQKNVHCAHRDLKPDNILVEFENGEVVNVTLIDFGIAKDPSNPQTQTMQIMGTPSYIAPEALLMGVRKIDQRADIFSLGVVFYQLLTGEEPFKYSAEELLNIMLHPEKGIENVTKTIKIIQSLRDHPDPRIPRSILNIVLKAMDPYPDNRYSTYNEFRLELGAALKILESQRR